MRRLWRWFLVKIGRLGVEQYPRMECVRIDYKPPGSWSYEFRQTPAPHWRTERPEPTVMRISGLAVEASVSMNRGGVFALGKTYTLEREITRPWPWQREAAS